MMDEPRPQVVVSQESIAGVLDQICDRFEAACKGTPPPRIEDFLCYVPASATDRGFRELLELELAYRRRAGQTPSADEYRSRFPQHAAAIDQLFQPPIGRPTIASPSAETIPARVADSFSDVVPAATLANASSSPGRTVGTTTSSGLRFRVIRQHARGGLGEVLIAEDQELHREVALKQIQSQYADDADSRTRFVLEAEVTGALEHPGIVPVYGLGSYADGRPFYAMRFIHGDSLKDAIDAYHDSDMGPRDPGERELELRKLLGRFVDVCDAIEYAHSRGIVHRDLKPGNIMLGNFGETLVVDWGLAKQIDQSESGSEHEVTEPQTKPMLLSGTAATRMGSAIGTPQYMSPEQAAGRLDLIGPRSDVYSLGATLYCLLTGKAPLSDRPAFDLDTILRRVKEGDIPPARNVHAGVPKGLEAICQRAMAVGPENRYPSARQLADDVEHWLADEPISALPDTRSQRVARWIRRHRSLTLATAIALVLISLVSTGATVLVNHLAVKNGELAEQEKVARKQAEDGFREARSAVDDLFTNVSEDTLLNQPGMQGLQKKLLGKTLDYYKRFLQQRSDDPSVQDEFGVTYYRVGRIVEHLDSPEKALPYYEQAEQLQERLLAQAPGNRERLNALGDSYNAAGGVLLQGQRFDDALNVLRKARDVRQKLVALAPRDLAYGRALANSMMNIGLVYRGLGRSADARDAQQDAQKIRKNHLSDGGDTSKLEFDLAKGSYNLGIQELRLNHVDTASKDFSESIAELRQLIDRGPRDRPPDQNLQYQLATCYRVAGDAVSRSSPTAALHNYQQARDALTQLVEHNPDVSDYKSALAGVYMNLANVERGADSIAPLEQARAVLAELAKKYPDNPQFDRDLAVTLRALADRQSNSGQYDAARANLESSLTLLAQLNKRLPNYKDVVQELAETRTALEQFNRLHPPVQVPNKPLTK